MAETAKIKILVVEDDLDLRDFIQDILSEQGYLVTTAGNGEEALARLDETPFPILVSDLTMSVMDGIMLLDTIKKGLFAEAADGNLLLDEIAEMPLAPGQDTEGTAGQAASTGGRKQLNPISGPCHSRYQQDLERGGRWRSFSGRSLLPAQYF